MNKEDPSGTCAEDACVFEGISAGTAYLALSGIVAAGYCVETCGAIVHNIDRSAHNVADRFKNYVFNSNNSSKAPRPSDGTPALEGAKPERVGQKGADDIYSKPGADGPGRANGDFDATVNPESVADRGSGIRTGQTPEGHNITVRPDSAKGKGPATVEITKGNGPARQTDKFRYPEN